MKSGFPPEPHGEGALRGSPLGPSGALFHSLRLEGWPPSPPRRPGPAAQVPTSGRHACVSTSVFQALLALDPLYKSHSVVCECDNCPGQRGSCPPQNQHLSWRLDIGQFTVHL